MAKASFWTQADALLRKNLTYQKRSKRTNAFLVAFPVVLCIVLSLLQKWVDKEYDQAEFKCGCNPLNKTQCGIPFSTSHQSSYCQIPRPSKWPTLLQVPDPRNRAVQGRGSCRNAAPGEGPCPVTILTTGNNYSLAQILGMKMLTTSPLNESDMLGSLSTNVFGSPSLAPSAMYIDSAFNSRRPLYYLQPQQCTSNSTSLLSYSAYNLTFKLELRCAQGRFLWRNTSSQINDELYQGYREGNSHSNVNEFLAGYDFLNSNDNNFNVSIWYNATYGNDTGFNRYKLIAMARLPRSVNLASNAFLQHRKGLATKVVFEFVKDMPKQETDLKIDIASQVGAQLYTYVIIALFPVILTFLVYENQNKLRIMMKMHGLGDGAYWLITYFYFLALSVAYIIFFMIFGSLIGLKIFTTNDYLIQFVLYFLYINLQILLAFLLAPLFTDVLTAQVAGNIMIFGSGLLGAFLFSPFVEDTTFPRRWIIMMELYPGFSLYRGLYELGEYSSVAYRVGASGMKWENLSNTSNGMKDVLIIMSLEWVLLLPFAYFVDRTASSSGIRIGFQRFLARISPPTNFLLQKKYSRVNPEMDKMDVIQEREKVEQLVKEGSLDKNVICENLRKVYVGRDGNSSKVAVKGLSLALSQGECFGMLGPNGAGKTSFIAMMTGLSKPTSGGAFVDGKSISTQMDEIYTNMGFCPQHDLLWEVLTGREHLLFYGRLKNLKGEALKKAVDDSLKSVALFHGGVGDRVAGKYSGGMKRRLSVAISLIGDPKVVYMDEPSTGLDPASRNHLWDVVKRAKQDKAIILTTHSMEEAEMLCDRLGIFVDGTLQCIGNPKELKARYGGSYVLTMTTSSTDEVEVERMVEKLSPSAQRIYHISGTQKFELSKGQVRISDVFLAVQRAKRSFTIYAWGISDATLEDVFIKVARQAQPFGLISS